MQTTSSLCRPLASGRTDHKLNATVEAIAGAASLAELDQTKARFLGKSGQLTALLKALGALPAEVQPVFTFAGVLTSTVQQPEAADALLHFLASPEAAPVIAKAGMMPVSKQ